MTPISRRNFLELSAPAAALAPFARTAPSQLPAAFSSLKPLGDRVHPITPDEFRARLLHAQSLMEQSRPAFDAIVIGPGTSLYYFSSVHWWLSERLTALVIPRSGEPLFLSPAFEEARLRESLVYPAEIRVWQEDENPSKLLVSALADRGLCTGRIGIEERLPFTFFDHFRAAAPVYDFVSADPVTIGCRAVKSPHELELMRLACEATCAVYRAVFANLKEGMTPREIGDLVSAGYAQMRLSGEAMVLLGPSAALPHGSKEPRKLREGDVVLLDDGCLVEGYNSDVTRTAVFGKPSEKQQRAFETVRKAQDAALDAARAGKLCGSVDDAARAVVIAAGYGPGYKYFLHRLGHGIGLDVHEHPYLVHGSATVLQPGMTFSNEPGIYVPGEFGIRCEDDMAIAADGPAQLLTPGFQVSLEKPFG
ncbi:MAG TPA: Xaa-Pro peptidase family protein [Candidatus Eisenbacteria bacterium]|nr:Xaa-Pro peptidase family protein [Candidatus Eisenbacteria bacterium]